MERLKLTHAYYIDAEIQAVTNAVCAVHHAVPEHCHDYYEFFLVNRGNCIHRVNGQEQFLAEGSLVFIRPTDVHAYEAISDTLCTFINTAFLGEVLQEVNRFVEEGTGLEGLLEKPLPPILLLPATDMQVLMHRMERFQMLAAMDKKRARLLFRALLMDVLCRFLLDQEEGTSDTRLPWLENLLIKMQKPENFTGGLPRLYALSGRSAGHINRVFRNLLNETPTTYLNRLKLGYARELLMTTEMKIIEVAMESGFDNLSHFHHTFRKAFGMAPTRMRERIRAVQGATAK